MNALVINAKSPPALAVIRSLGRQGIEVTGASDSPGDFPLFSRYCRHKILLQTAAGDIAGRITELLEIVRKDRYDVFLPVMSENLLLALAGQKSIFEQYTRLTLPDYEHLKVLNNKAMVSALMTELGIPHPATFCPGADFVPGEKIPDMRFPLIIKPCRGEGAKGVKIVFRPEEFESIYREISKTHGPVVIQEFIEGVKNNAVFLLNRDSEIRRFFVFRAIREYPVTGGPTCFLRSVRYDQISEYGSELLRRISFSGLAEIEFIIDSRDNIPKIIDVNPRFFGPLQGAVSAGVDLPHAFYRLALNGDIEKDLDYREGITCRHLAEDTKQLLSVLKGAKSPKYKIGKAATLINYLNFFRDDSYFILSLDDPLPVIKRIFRTL